MTHPRDSAARDDLLLTLINEDEEPKPLPLSLLAEITDFFSTENIIGQGGFAMVYKGSIGSRVVAVKRLLDTVDLDEKGFIREIECLRKVKHKNIVRLLGFCYEVQGDIGTCDEKPVLVRKVERLLCFQYLQKGGLDKSITDSGLQWEQRYQIINGVCRGLHQLHENKILHLDLKPQNILLDDDNVPKIADFGLARCLQKGETRVHTKTMGGTLGYMAPEFINSGLITKKCDLYSLGAIIMDLLTGTHNECTVEDVLDSWISRFGESKTRAQLEQIKICAQIGVECSNLEPENRPQDTKHIIDRLENVGSAQETQQSAGKLLLQVHPTFLVFELQPAGKLTPCLLHLTNDTDERMMFKLRTAESVNGCWSEQFLPRYGFVAARSTYTLVLTVSWERDLPEKGICDMILESCPTSMWYSEFDSRKIEELFDAMRTDNAVKEVKLAAYLWTQHRRQSTIPTVNKNQATGQLGVTISWMEKQKPRTELYSVDAHPTKPWIITGHERGRVIIRNHDTQKLLYSFKVSRGPVYSVKFIARKQWFICGTDEGLAHVYSYETQEMQKINSFRVCDDDDAVCDLAVHPSLAYVMSWSQGFNDDDMKLWDWDNGWECTRTFQISDKTVRQVAFDPKETNRFAATAFDPSGAEDVTVWSLDSPEPEYQLPLVDFKGIRFLEFFTRYGRQCLFITDEDKEAHVWDLQQRELVFEKRKSLSPDTLRITLSSWNGTCVFWSAKDFSLYGVLNNSSGGNVQGIACLMGSKKRFVIGQVNALTVLDIEKAIYQEDLRESTETKLCNDIRQSYTSSELITQEPSEIHHIHPLKAHFSFQDDKLIPCLLHLTNKTDKHTAFMLSSTTEEQQPFEATTPLNYGIVPSRSIYTLDFKMPAYKQKSNLILQSSISGDRYLYTFEDQSECHQFFEDAKETRNVVHEVVLEPVLSQKGETASSENRSTGQDVTQTSIQIRGLCYPTTDNDVKISSLDVNPAESWIMTFDKNGDFFIRDIDTQEMIYLMSTEDDVCSIKIITRKQWVLVGTLDGFIQVYEYETGMTRIKRFRAISNNMLVDNIDGVLDVHPTLPYVLSAYDSEMKLWDWDKGWECIKKFKLDDFITIRHVAFSPEGTNTFATASSDGDIKLWNHSPPTVEHTLCGHEGRVNCLDFFRGDDGIQYLISGSDDCTAKIWGLQEKTCLRTLDVFRSPVTCVISLPDSPYMITGSEDGTVHLWSSPSFRLERVLQIGCTRRVRSLCLMGSKRVLIEKMGEISIMDIDTSSKEPPELLLHVHPTKLVFELQPGKLSQCSLQLTNDTDQEMVFKLSSTESVDWSEQFLPRYGIVAAHSTYTLILNVFLERDIAEKRYCDMILESCTCEYGNNDKYSITTWENIFDNQETNNNVANEVKLRACLSSSQHRQSIVAPMPTRLGVRVSWMEKPRTRLLSVDAHPTKPWIITGYECGGVAIRNHDTQSLLCSFNVSRGPVHSVKFIAQKQWFICSSAEGFIHVYSYEIPKMQKIKSFRAYGDGPVSLAVHPTQPYVMSWSANHTEMKLWDWDKGWECTRTFQNRVEDEEAGVDHVAFDPKETDRFVSITFSFDYIVQIWTLDSSEPESDRPYTGFKGTRFLEFFTLYGRQYLIIAGESQKAEVWDLQRRKFVFEEPKSLSLEASVLSRPNLPVLLLTPSSKGTCRFWSTRDFSLYGVLDNSRGGDVQGIACLMASKTRFVIGQEHALTILHIDNATYRKDSRQSIEPQLCADTRQGDTSSKKTLTGSGPTDVEVFVAGHRGSDSQNADVLCTQTATDHLAAYGEKMIECHGQDYDWRTSLIDPKAAYASSGGQAHKRLGIFDSLIDSKKFRHQGQTSISSSSQMSRSRISAQDIEIARMQQAMRKQMEYQRLQAEHQAQQTQYYVNLFTQQQAFLSQLAQKVGIQMPAFGMPPPPFALPPPPPPQFTWPPLQQGFQTPPPTVAAQGDQFGQDDKATSWANNFFDNQSPTGGSGQNSDQPGAGY